jgi:hypothetical protein
VHIGKSAAAFSIGVSPKRTQKTILFRLYLQLRLDAAERCATAFSDRVD